MAGKTSIVLQYKYGKIPVNIKGTVGAGYYQKNFSFPDGYLLKLHIWDTSGYEKFEKVAPLYYKDAHAALVVYGVDDQRSFDYLDYWIKQLDKHSNQPKMVKYLIGNKSDVDKERRKVQMKDGKNFSELKKMEFFETSAKVNDGSINDVFSTLAQELLKVYKQEELVCVV